MGGIRTKTLYAVKGGNLHPILLHIDWSSLIEWRCFYYSIRISQVALLEALSARYSTHKQWMWMWETWAGSFTPTHHNFTCWVWVGEVFLVHVNVPWHDTPKPHTTERRRCTTATECVFHSLYSHKHCDLHRFQYRTTCITAGDMVKKNLVNNHTCVSIYPFVYVWIHTQVYTCVLFLYPHKCVCRCLLLIVRSQDLGRHVLLLALCL